MTAIFTLASCFVATAAWFYANTAVSSNGMQVQIKANGGVSISAIKLVKFNYAKLTGAEDLLDYLSPQKGHVDMYNYENNSFGYTEDGSWHTVSIMNAYDPVEKIIKGNSFDLSSMNCNAIYEITFSAPVNDYLLSLTAKAIDKQVNYSVGEISMLECADIDIYYESDLATTVTTYKPNTAYAANDVVLYESVAYICPQAITAGNNTSFDTDDWQAIDEFDSEKVYTASQNYNDYVFYNKCIYKCTTTTGDTSFNASHWTAFANDKQPSAFDCTVAYSAGDYVTYSGSCYQILEDIAADTYTANSDFEDEILSDPNQALVEEIGDYVANKVYKTNAVIFRSDTLYFCNTATGEAFNASHWAKFANYDVSGSYVKDDVVAYDGILYACKTPVSSSSFNETSWRPLIYSTIHHPSYKTPTAGSTEDLFYKISYLSAKTQQHKHFYFSDSSWNSAHWEQVTTTPSAYATATAYAVYDVVSYSNKYYQCITPLESSENTEFKKSQWREIAAYSNNTSYCANNYVVYNNNLYKCVADTINVNNTETVLINKNGEGNTNPLKIYINVNYAPSQLNDYYEKINTSDIKKYNAIFDFGFVFDFQDVQAEQGN